MYSYEQACSDTLAVLRREYKEDLESNSTEIEKQANSGNRAAVFTDNSKASLRYILKAEKYGVDYKIIEANTTIFGPYLTWFKMYVFW